MSWNKDRCSSEHTWIAGLIGSYSARGHPVVVSVRHRMVTKRDSFSTLFGGKKEVVHLDHSSFLLLGDWSRLWWSTAAASSSRLAWSLTASPSSSPCRAYGSTAMASSSAGSMAAIFACQTFGCSSSSNGKRNCLPFRAKVVLLPSACHMTDRCYQWYFHDLESHMGFLLVLVP